MAGNTQINQLSREEIIEQHLAGIIAYCPVCKKYHWAEKRIFIYNMAKCQNCKGKENGSK